MTRWLIAAGAALALVACEQRSPTSITADAVPTDAAIYIVNSSGAPPPNERVLAWAALSAWLLPPWAWWFDRHRDAGPPLATPDA